jgi:hypothetical protein
MRMLFGSISNLYILLQTYTKSCYFMSLIVKI